MELKILLEKSKATIKELNTMLVKYKDENGKLREYMEGVTKYHDFALKAKIDGPETQVSDIRVYAFLT